MEQDYSYSELVKMQDKAIERVRQMQERARRTVEGTYDGDMHTEEKKEERRKEQPPPEAEANSFEEKRKLFGDKDIATILPILLLLMNEGADSLLLMALVYIMS